MIFPSDLILNHILPKLTVSELFRFFLTNKECSEFQKKDELWLLLLREKFKLKPIKGFSGSLKELFLATYAYFSDENLEVKLLYPRGDQRKEKDPIVSIGSQNEDEYDVKMIEILAHHRRMKILITHNMITQSVWYWPSQIENEFFVFNFVIIGTEYYQSLLRMKVVAGEFSIGNKIFKVPLNCLEEYVRKNSLKKV